MTIDIKVYNDDDELIGQATANTIDRAIEELGAIERKIEKEGVALELYHCLSCGAEVDASNYVAPAGLCIGCYNDAIQDQEYRWGEQRL